MSYITISKAAEILRVNKKTLFRWDSEGRFIPAKREEVSKIRLYDEQDVMNLKIVLDHESRNLSNLREIKKVQTELTEMMSVFLISDKEVDLQKRAVELLDIHKKIVEEYASYPEKIQQIHRTFYKI